MPLAEDDGTVGIDVTQPIGYSHRVEDGVLLVYNIQVRSPHRIRGFWPYINVFGQVVFEARVPPALPQKEING